MNKEPKHNEQTIEFFKHNDAELQPLLDEATRLYYRRSEGLHFRGVAANVEIKHYQPLLTSLTELAELIKQGYVPKFAEIAGLDFNVIVQKPPKTIAAELAKIHAAVTADYTAARHARNADELERQISITLSRNAREAEKAAIEAQRAIDAEIAAAAQAERQAALGDLLEAYSKQEAA